MSDNWYPELVEAIRARDQEKLDKLVKVGKSRMGAVASKLPVTAGRPSDVTQKVFLRAVEIAAQVPATSPPRNLAIRPETLAYGVKIDLIRQDDAPREVGTFDHDSIPAAPSPTPSESLMLKERAQRAEERVRLMYQQMTASERQLVDDRLAEGHSFEQIERAHWAKEKVRLANQQMTASERQLIDDRLAKGRSFEQIGQRLGVKADTARKRFRRLIERLQQWAIRTNLLIQDGSA